MTDRIDPRALRAAAGVFRTPGPHYNPDASTLFPAQAIEAAYAPTLAALEQAREALERANEALPRASVTQRKAARVHVRAALAAIALTKEGE